MGRWPAGLRLGKGGFSPPVLSLCIARQGKGGGVLGS